MILSQAPLLLCAGVSMAASHQGQNKPNFIMIMTDDQDLHMNSLDYQPSVRRHFMEEGTWFQKHYCTVSQCCPSRVSLLTGKAAHNTNVTDVVPPYGGYPKFVEQGLNDNYLPLWLQNEGYNTYYTGKLMNGHSTANYDSPRVSGWNASNFLLDPYTYKFYNFTMTRDNEPWKSYPKNYSTDVTAADAISYLDEAIAAPDRPFFLGVMPIAPHCETISRRPLPTIFLPPVAAKRHEHLYPGVKVPRTPHFNPDVPGAASYMKTMRKLNQTELDFYDEWYRVRLQTLAAVDELIDSIMGRLNASPEVLENTYIIYTSDNGFHIGQHRLPPGKTCNIEEDVNVPFFIRGPGIAKNTSSTVLSSHTDVIPTLFKLAGIPLHDDFDGEPMPVTQELLIGGGKSEQVNIEFWGPMLLEGNAFNGLPNPTNNTYKHVRVLSTEYNLSYSVWCTNDHELYNLATDPHQMINLYGTNGTVDGWEIGKLTARLDGLLLTLKGCKGRTCTRPWEKLHPHGAVSTLKDAMDPKYDVFYMEEQHQVSFSECQPGQILESEGVQEPVLYQPPDVYQPEWDEWSWQT